MTNLSCLAIGYPEAVTWRFDNRGYLNRWIRPDTIIPDLSNPQDLNRYAYCRNNPLTYIDRDGHIAFIPLLIVGVIVAAKAIDYGWTAYDAAQSLKVMNDPNASEAAKTAAAASLALTVAFEAAEPDDLLPVSLPLDDLARKGILKLGKEATETTAEKADGFIRAIPADQMGTSQGFKTWPGEDGLSVFEGVSSNEVLAELPGKRVPNATVSIPQNALPSGTQVKVTEAPGLS